MNFQTETMSEQMDVTDTPTCTPTCEFKEKRDWIELYHRKRFDLTRKSIVNACKVAQSMGLLDDDFTITVSGSTWLETERETWGYCFDIQQPNYKQQARVIFGSVGKHQCEQEEDAKMIGYNPHIGSFMKEASKNCHMFAVMGVARLTDGFNENEEIQYHALENAASWIMALVNKNRTDKKITSFAELLQQDT
jgi:hypothetical protein